MPLHFISVHIGTHRSYIWLNSCQLWSDLFLSIFCYWLKQELRDVFHKIWWAVGHVSFLYAKVYSYKHNFILFTVGYLCIKKHGWIVDFFFVTPRQFSQYASPWLNLYISSSINPYFTTCEYCPLCKLQIYRAPLCNRPDKTSLALKRWYSTTQLQQVSLWMPTAPSTSITDLNNPINTLCPSNS